MLSSQKHTTGPELIDDSDEPPLPIGMVEAAVDATKDDQDDSERPGPAMNEDQSPDYQMNIGSMIGARLKVFQAQHVATTTDMLQVEQVDRTIPATTRESIESNLDVEVNREDNSTPPTANGNGLTVSNDIINVNVDQAEDNATHVLPTAVWLPDEAVYDATPLEPALPWWKQRRAKILLILIVIAIVSALAIALGVSFSSERNSTGAEDRTL